MSEFARHFLLVCKMVDELDCGYVHGNQAYFGFVRWHYAQALIGGKYL
jgi:hypothetical protein